MIGDTTLDGGYGSGLAVDNLAAANLRKAGKWARLIGIITMVSLSLGILFLLLFGGTFFAMALGTNSTAAGAGSFLSGVIFFYAVIFAILFYLTYLLYNFGAKAMVAVDRGDTVAMTDAFASLGRLLKIFGILTIINLLFTALGFLGVAAGGLATMNF